MKKLFYIILNLIFLSSCFANEAKHDNSVEVHGELKNGLREIFVDLSKPMNYKVYRGDYVVFKFKTRDIKKFSIPELEINTTFPRPNGEKPYIKLKKSGKFKFTLGNYEGTLEVIDYTQGNYTEVTAEEAVNLIETINPFILDVRTHGEYEAGHLENAGLVPVQVLSSNIEALKSFKDEPILIYCQSGNRSTVASKILIDEGFKNIYNLRYGIGEWKTKGLKTVK